MRPSASSAFLAIVRRRSLAGSGRATVLSKSKVSSTFDDTLLTFCPPGPDARTAVHSRSLLGSVILSLMTSGVPMSKRPSHHPRAQASTSRSGAAPTFLSNDEARRSSDTEGEQEESDSGDQ